jgi:anti-sigma regulatory factor (Ser/Thr protein kinase)
LGSTLLARKTGKALGLLIMEINARLAHTGGVGQHVGHLSAVRPGLVWNGLKAEKINGKDPRPDGRFGGDMRFTLRQDVRSAREARLKLRAMDGLPEHVLTDAETVISELVTNSLRHASLGYQEVIEVALEQDEVHLVIVVDDHDGFWGISGADRPARQSDGMGLRLLDAICDDWHAEAGRVVASLAI